jgi:hypothetical protein
MLNDDTGSPALAICFLTEIVLSAGLPVSLVSKKMRNSELRETIFLARYYAF